MYKNLFVLFAIIGMTGLAQAQEQKSMAASLSEVEDDTVKVEALNLTVKQLDDMAITDANGQRLGKVDEVLMTPDKKITAVSAEFGGFLGMGEKEVVVRIDQLQRDGDTLKTSMTKEQFMALEAWSD